MNTGRYKKQKQGYRKRTGSSKLLVKFSLVEERLGEEVKSPFTIFDISKIHFITYDEKLLYKIDQCNLKKTVKNCQI